MEANFAVKMSKSLHLHDISDFLYSLNSSIAEILNITAAEVNDLIVRCQTDYRQERKEVKKILKILVERRFIKKAVIAALVHRDPLLGLIAGTEI